MLYSNEIMNFFHKNNGHKGYIYLSKDIINKKGVESIRSSGRVFRQFQSYDGRDKVNIDDFIFGLRECGINLPKEDLDVILNFFDKDKDGYINFTEFSEAFEVPYYKYTISVKTKYRYVTV